MLKVIVLEVQQNKLEIGISSNTLRGKILNVYNVGLSKIADNNEIQNLIQSWDVGSEKILKFQKRYEKIILMTDADVDGSHIATLLTTFINI